MTNENVLNHADELEAHELNMDELDQVSGAGLKRWFQKLGNKKAPKTIKAIFTGDVSFDTGADDSFLTIRVG